jgi:hypothetical protein
LAAIFGFHKNNPSRNDNPKVSFLGVLGKMGLPKILAEREVPGLPANFLILDVPGKYCII